MKLTDELQLLAECFVASPPPNPPPPSGRLKHEAASFADVFRFTEGNSKVEKVALWLSMLLFLGWTVPIIVLGWRVETPEQQAIWTLLLSSFAFLLGSARKQESLRRRRKGDQ